MSEDRAPRIKMSGLWKSETKDGTVYLSGSNGSQRWSIWPNGFKGDNDKAPSHVLYVEAVQKREECQADKGRDSLDDL